jgi:uncharacterized membrane protein
MKSAYTIFIGKFEGKNNWSLGTDGRIVLKFILN